MNVSITVVIKQILTHYGSNKQNLNINVPGHDQVIRLLSDGRADPNAARSNGTTPLHIASGTAMCTQTHTHTNACMTLRYACVFLFFIFLKKIK